MSESLPVDQQKNSSCNPRYYRRPRIFDLFRQAVFADVGILTVIAPAGAGKSTLIRTWFEDIGKSETDSLCFRMGIPGTGFTFTEFLVGFCSLFESLFPEEVSRIVNSDYGGYAQFPQLLCAPLFRRIQELGTQVYIAIDDLHFLDIEDDFLYRLFLSLPDQVRLILISRCSLNALLSKINPGLFFQLPSRELSFSPDETRDYLQSLDPRFWTPERCRNVQKITEGWAAALKVCSANPDFFATDSLHESGIFLMQRLFNHHLSVMETGEKNLLCSAACLGEFSIDLLSDLYPGFMIEDQLKDWISKGFLLEQIDSFLVTFRFHALASDYLASFLPSHNRTRLLIEAAEWHSENAQWSFTAALLKRLIISGSPFREINHLVESFFYEKCLTGEVEPIQTLAKIIPRQELLSHPVTCSYLLLSCIYQDQLVMIQAFLDPLMEAYPRMASLKVIRMMYYMIMGDLTKFRDFAGLLEDSISEGNDHLFYPLYLFGKCLVTLIDQPLSKGIQILEDTESRLMGDSGEFIFQITRSQHQHVLLMMGEIRKVDHLFLQTFQEDESPSFPIGASSIAGILAAFMAGHFPEVLRRAGIGSRIFGKTGMRKEYYLCLYYEIMACMLTGQFHEAKKLIDVTRQEIREDRLIDSVSAQQVNDFYRFLIILWNESSGNPPGKIPFSIADIPFQLCIVPIPYYHVLLFLLIRMIDQGRLADAETYIDDFLLKARQSEVLFMEISLNVLKSAVLLHSGKTAAGFDLLNRMWAEADERGIAIPFILSAQLFSRFISGRSSTVSEELHDLLMTMRVESFRRDNRNSRGNQEPELLSPLGKREIEILHMVQLGLENRKIAERLNISVNTAKWHLKNINQKLYSANRMQAVETARRLGLI